ncbi:MAG: NAD(P)-dependent oxidoreductase [Microthrixaceae bacterium]
MNADFEAPDVNGRRLIFTATGISQVDRQVFGAAEKHGIWVNSADDPPQCSFILPAVLRHEPVVIAVSTSGTSPALASYLRDRISKVIAPEIASVANELAEQRARVKNQGQPTEGVDWRPVIEALLADAGLPEVVI